MALHNKKTEQPDPLIENPTEEPKIEKEPDKKKGSGFFLSVLAISAALYLIFYLVVNDDEISSWFNKLMGVLSPVVAGLVIAYLLNPALRFFELKLFRKMKRLRLRRILAMICTYLSLLLIISLFALLIIPELISSVKELLDNYQSYVDSTVEAINNVITSLNAHIKSESLVLIDSTQITNYITTLLTTTGEIYQIVAKYAVKYVSGIVNGLQILFVAIFISIYFLSSKEKRYAQIGMATHAVFSEKQCGTIKKLYNLVDRSFGGYIEAQLLDAIIVAVESFILFSIFGIPYTMLISTIIGVTNIIPIFGPILGAVPSGFIILVSEPKKVIPFIILIFVIQQIDGNIVAPRLLGQNTGVSSLCVLIAITIMGSYWGVLGMILGVPIFSVIITLLEVFIKSRLHKKSMAEEIDSYYAPDAVRIPKPEKNFTVRLYERMRGFLAKVKKKYTETVAKIKLKRKQRSSRKKR